MLRWLILLTFVAISIFANPQYDVIILGAGMAGIGAAKELHESGVTNFVVLEANDYIGGRVKNVDFDNTSIPLGAGWIQLAEQNHSVFRLVKKYNLDLYKDSYDLSKIPFWNRNDRSVYSSADVVGKYNELETKLGEMDTRIEKRIESGAADMDLASGLRWVGWNPKTLLDTAVEYFVFDWENGIPPGVISATAYGYTGKGEDYVVTDRRGYIYPFLQEINPYISKFHLNQTVTRIKRNSERNYSVYTDNGKEWTTKFVLVTFSSGVLNSDVVKFEPALPDWKKESLALVPMCYYCKIYAQFSEKFWNDTTYFMVASQIRGNYFHWQDASAIFNISNVLVALLTGQTCKDSYAYTDNEIADQIYAVLRDIYPTASKPTKIFRNTFNNDPKFMGAYSYQTPGINENDYRSIEHPVQQNLWFAGEYLGRWDYGFAHGAYQIGQNITKQMIDCMNNKKCPADEPTRQSRQSDCSSDAVQINHISLSLMVSILFLFYSIF